MINGKDWLSFEEYWIGIWVKIDLMLRGFFLKIIYIIWYKWIVNKWNFLILFFENKNNRKELFFFLDFILEVMLEIILGVKLKVICIYISFIRG